MGISDLADKILLKPYLDGREETYYQARDLALVTKIRELLDSPHP